VAQQGPCYQPQSLLCKFQLGAAVRYSATA
jgi:hypothetical protein